MRALLISAAVVAAGATAALADGTTTGSCQAADLQGYVGKPQSALEGVVLQGPIRIIDPETPADGTVNPARLNLQFDGDGNIVAITCG